MSAGRVVRALRALVERAGEVLRRLWRRAPGVVEALERAGAPEYVVSWARSFGGDDERLWAECPRAYRLLSIAAAAGVRRAVLRAGFDAAAARAAIETTAKSRPRTSIPALPEARALVARWTAGEGEIGPALSALRDALEDVALHRAELSDGEQRAENIAVEAELHRELERRGDTDAVTLTGHLLELRRRPLLELRARARVEAVHRTFSDAVRAAIDWPDVEAALRDLRGTARGPYR